MDRRRLRHEVLGDANGRGVHHELPDGRTTGDERPGAAREPSVVLVTSGIGRLDVRRHFGGELVHRRLVGEVVDDGVAVLPKMGRDLRRIGVPREVGQSHGCHGIRG